MNINLTGLVDLEKRAENPKRVVDGYGLSFRESSKRPYASFEKYDASPSRSLRIHAMVNTPSRLLPTSLLLAISSIALLTSSSFAAEAAKAKPAHPKAPKPSPQKRVDPVLPTPTIADVAYGKHPKQVMHFWKAESDKPTPLLFFIHGGGWQSGDRTKVAGILPAMLKAGISVVSIEYRFIAESTADGVVPPVKGPLGDAARALQFVRSMSKEWNIDKQRIAACGGSAGACSSLWLAFHVDMADPKSSDPIAHESTRLFCAAVDIAQTTLDPMQMKEWTPNSTYGGHAFGFKNFGEFLAKRDTILPWIAEYSPYALVTKDDPAIYLAYKTPPALGQDQKDPTHTSNFGVKLQEHCKEIGVECELFYPGVKNVMHSTTQDFLIERLKGAPAKN